MEHDFIVFFLNYCLDHYFKSKADMARQIGVNVCALMRVMNPPYHFKAGSVPFQNTVPFPYQQTQKSKKTLNESQPITHIHAQAAAEG